MELFSCVYGFGILAHTGPVGEGKEIIFYAVGVTEHSMKEKALCTVEEMKQEGYGNFRVRICKTDSTMTFNIIEEFLCHKEDT